MKVTEANIVVKLKILSKKNHYVYSLLRLVKIGFLILLKSPYFLTAIPSVVLLRLLKFVVVIRFGNLDASIAFGGFWSPELYLSEKDLGLQKKGAVDIFYSVGPLKFQTLAKKWKSLIRFYPESDLLEMIHRINQWIPGYEDHVIVFETSHPYILNYKLSLLKTLSLFERPAHLAARGSSGRESLMKTEPHITFTMEEETIAKEIFQKIKLPDNYQYICFHVRDSAYKLEIIPDRDWNYHNYRDSDINACLPMAETLAQREYFLVRMGAKVEKPLDTNSPRIIDYASNYQSELMDLYIGSKCWFFVCGACGITTIPIVFRKPIVLLNLIPMDAPITGTEYDLFLPKKLWLRKEKRFLTFREIFESKIIEYDNTKDYEDSGIEVIDNSSEEIKDVVLEMEARLLGVWSETEEEMELQQKFKQILNNCKMENNIMSRIGTKFLQKNVELLY